MGKDVVTAVLAAVAIIATAYQFIWLNIIHANQLPPELSQSCSITKVGLNSSFNVYQAHLKVHNPGTKRTYILCSYYNVIGSLILRANRDDTFEGYVRSQSDSLNDPRQDVVQLRRFVYEPAAKRAMIECGSLTPGSKQELDAGEDSDTEFLIYVPKELRFSQIRIRVGTVLSSDDTATLIHLDSNPTGELYPRQSDIKQVSGTTSEITDFELSP